MSHSKRALSVLLPILLLITSPAWAEKSPVPAGAPSGSITVGEFAVKVASLALDSPAERQALTPKTALESLGRAGLRFGTSHDAVLTEADLSGFFRQAGVRLEVSRPANPVSAAQAGAVLSSFGRYFASRAADPARNLLVNPPDRLSSAAPLPEDLSQCLVLPTVPECKACCLSLPGIEENGSCGRACGRAHAGKVVSPTDPQP
jgi:hypothetical protein